MDSAAPIQNMVAWFQHTLGLEILKKSVMDISIKRSIIDKLNSLSTANIAIQTERATLNTKYEESRSNAGDLIESFTEIMAQKDAVIAELKEKCNSPLDAVPLPNTPAPIYSNAVKKPSTRSSRSIGTKRTESARSKSRIQKRTKVLADKREKPPTTLIFTPTEEYPALKAKEDIWKLVSNATKTPKIQSLLVSSGKLIF